MRVDDYIKQDAIGLAKLIKQGEVDAKTVLNCALDRMYEVNPLINAVVTDCRDWALERLSCMRGDEPFYGVPVLIKDLSFTLQDVRDTSGSRFFADHIASENSEFIQRLLSLGMVPFAKTNTPELGLSYVTESVLFGPCRNPYDLERTAGGSSGGSAAAVATGIAPIATANDGGGSIRLPAACCGLFGFKPTTGATPRGSASAETWSGMGSSYVLTRMIQDSAQLFDYLTDIDFHVPPQKPVTNSLNIIRLEGPFAEIPIAPPCLEAVEKMLAVLDKAGIKVHSQHLSLDQEAIGQAALILIAADIYTKIETHETKLKCKVGEQQLEPATWEFYQWGKWLRASEYIKAKNVLYQHLRPLHRLLHQADMVLTPALAQLPLKIGQLRTDDPFELYLQKHVAFSPFMSLFNQAGVPAMTMPVMHHQRLPVSVQFAAAKGQYKSLLQLALKLQSFLPDFSQPVTPKK